MGVATSLVKRRQQVPKPRGSPDMTTLKPLLSKGQGQHRRDRQWRGFVGSAGVLDRGKGTGWIAWEPERSRSRPRESSRHLGSRRNKCPGPGWSSTGTGALRKRARTPEGSRGARKRTNKQPGMRVREVVAPSSYRRRRGTGPTGTRPREGRRHGTRAVGGKHGRRP